MDSNLEVSKLSFVPGTKTHIVEFSDKAKLVIKPKNSAQPDSIDNLVLFKDGVRTGFVVAKDNNPNYFSAQGFQQKLFANYLETAQGAMELSNNQFYKTTLSSESYKNIVVTLTNESAPTYEGKDLFPTRLKAV